MLFSSARSRPIRRYAALGLLAIAACRQQTLPEVPVVSFADFASPGREHMQSAFDAVRRNPRDAEANGRLGMILHAYEQHAPAEAAYRRAHLLDRDAFKWVYCMALVQEARGNREGAISSLRAAIRLDPNFVPAELRLAELMLASGDFDASARLYERIAARNADLAAAHYGLGRARAAQENTGGAIQAWERACAISPDAGSVHHALAGAYRKVGDTNRAEFHAAAHKRSRRALPPVADHLDSEIRSLNRSAQTYMRQGIELADAGRLAEAAEAHERALEIDANLGQAHVNLITLYARQGRTGLAEEHYRKTIAANPHDAEAHYNYGVMMLELGRRTEAKTAFRAAVDSNPRHADALNSLGYFAMEDGALAEAERMFGRAIEHEPGHRLAHFHLGQILVHRKDYAGAIQHFSKILDPEDDRTPGFLYALAATHARAGRRDKALEIARTARRKAAAFGQAGLVTDIESDIARLERRR
jgi:tetratricopeptide (TPR) repeat protein